MYNDVCIDELKNCVLVSVKVNDDATELEMKTVDGVAYTFYHSQNCCELVWIADITGDLSDLIGDPLLFVECSTSEMTDEDCKNSDRSQEEGLWTFYKFATRKGYVDIRWCGMSNGYYSMGVSIRKE